MFKKPEDWRIGTQIYDMHDGWGPILKECEVKNIVSWTLFPDMRQAFTHILDVARMTGNYTRYTNKMLVIIGEGSEFWIAAWCYDGTQAGICYIKPKKGE